MDHPGSSPHLKILNLIISAKTLFKCDIHNFQGLVPRAKYFFEPPHSPPKPAILSQNSIKNTGFNVIFSGIPHGFPGDMVSIVTSNKASFV